MDGSSPESSRIADLEQALLDERAMRSRADRRINELEDRVGTWRNRAEARAERIRSLEAERDRRWLRIPRRSSGRGADAVKPPPVAVPATSSIADVERPSPSIAGIRIAHNADDTLGRVLGEGRVSTLAEGSWDECDLVVIDRSRLDARGVDAVDAWLERDVRPVALEVVAGPDASSSYVALVGGGRRHDPFSVPASLDVVTDIPSAASQVRPADGAEVVDVDGSPIGVVADLDDATPYSVVSLAGRAVPVASSAQDVVKPGQGERARRWAWHHRDPARLLSTLLVAANIPHRDPRPRVAGLLVSNRPDRVEHAARSFLAQTYAHRELVIGCHGFRADAVRSAMESLGPDSVVSIIELPDHRSLGWCLDEVASQTSAPVLAKIDDDDHYGPNYVEDAVQALRYSRAHVVGKAAQFTYVESADRTVLRRSGTEQTIVGGTLTGATLVFRRELWESVGFPDRPRMVDVGFLEAARAVGATVFANSRWEFVYRRSTSGHTWQIDDETFLAGAVDAWDGWRPERADL